LLWHLDGQTTLDEAVDEIKRETRRFAKRQITWFKRDQRIRWFDVFAFSDIMALSESLAAYYEQSMQLDEGEGDHL
jgi:tRNA dimethylallyltransferase